jgi:hypothetical protein
MTDIMQKKACCWFYKSTSGTAQAGGCSKAYLDSVGGDVSTIMETNGAPKFSGTLLLENKLIDDQPQAQTTDLGLFAVAKEGLVANVDNVLQEIITVIEPYTRFNGWVGEQSFDFWDPNGGSSQIQVADGTAFSVYDPILISSYSNGLGQYTILAIDGNVLTIDDAGQMYGQSGTCAPITAMASITVGGAYNDLQDVLNITDAVYHDQWIFLNEELAPSTSTSGTAYWIYSSHDGEAANNTKLYIVGYNTYAYDCLPDGYGYFPEGTLNAATHYKTPLERAKKSLDALIKADLPTGSCKNLPGSSDHLFRLYTNTENIQFMGIYFETNRSCRPIIVDNESTGSMFVKHCSAGHLDYDTNPQFLGGRCVWVNRASTGGGIFDSFFKGVELFNGTQPSVDYSGDWEFAYNVGIHTGNINPEYSGPVVHHNIFVKSQWGATAVARSYQNVFNNVFYLCQRAGFNLNGTEGRTRAWNNIIVMDETSGLFYGLFSVAAGGTVDYFDFNCYCNQEALPISVFANDAGVNPSFNFKNLKKGAHDIEADPMFMDPENWDFRLRPNSPCLGAGRPDLQGNPSNIGPYSKQEITSLYGKEMSLYGV